MSDVALVDILNVEMLNKHCFRSIQHKENFRQSLYGGQVLAQALMAACKTVETRKPHSMHAYFLRPGTSSEPVDYEVEDIRNGKSISSRRIVAFQNGQPIFNASVSFHASEPGFQHQDDFPSQIPSPEELLAISASRGVAAEHKSHVDATSPFIMLPIPEDLFTSTKCHAPDALFWIKTINPLPRLYHYQVAALAFISDIGLLAASVLPHPSSLFEADLVAASIDHALWIHDTDFDLSEWVLCKTHSPWAGQARGFAQASLYAHNGKLLANIAQEGLIRKVSV